MNAGEHANAGTDGNGRERGTCWVACMFHRITLYHFVFVLE